MKMKPEHFQKIENAIEAVIDPERIDAHIAYLRTDPRVKDLKTRLRWDVFSYAISPAFICQDLYPYLNDDHIDSALRKIFSKYDFYREI